MFEFGLENRSFGNETDGNTLLREHLRFELS